jgi:hypothetical protein
MSKKFEVAVTENGLQFLATSKDGRVSALSGDFAFVQPLDAEQAVDKLKGEVSQRGNVTRAALSCLLNILSSMGASYRGEGDINQESGLSKEFKTAARTAEDAYFRPMFKDGKKADAFITQLREAGIYATVKGVALKYWYFAGKLPCLYVGDVPNTDKLLSVSAMQRLLQNMQEDKEPEDKSISARILALHNEMLENKEHLPLGHLENILYVLGQMTQDAKELRNALNIAATEKLALTAPQSSLDAQIAEAWAVKDAEEALM